jgi:hypothetical protein
MSKKYAAALLACVIALFVYVIISITQLLLGMSDPDGAPIDTNCNKEKTRIEYIFPAYRIGCWLGRPPINE